MTASIEAPRIFFCRRYRNCPAMIDWLVDVAGFTRHAVYEDGAGGIAHAQLAFGSAMIMVGSVREDDYGASVGAPGGAGDGSSVYVAVDDVDALHDRIRDNGGTIVRPLADQDYGSREFGCRDPEGTLWNFGTYWPKAHEAAG